MSLIARALGAGSRRSWDQFSGYSDGRIPPNSADAIRATGGPVSEAQVRSQIDAYACTTLIADSVSMLPLDSFRRSGTYRQPVPSAFIDRPDPELERGEFIAQVVDSLAIRGNAYLPFLAVDRSGYPSATRCLHPDDVRPVKTKAGDLVYELRNGNTIPNRSMLHIRLHPVPGQITGLSPIECARRGIRTAIDTEEFGARWFTDGAAPSSVLETDADLTDEQSRRTQAKWIASHGGRRSPAVLTGGLKWRPVTITPNESQFLETRQLNTAQIARIWRVAPHLIGDVERSTSWGTGIEQQGIGFVVYTLGIYLTRIEAALSSAKASPRGQFAKFNVGALLRGDTSARFQSYAIGRQWGWLSVNDIRALEDLPPIDGGDTYLQPLNMVDAEKALAALKLNGGQSA